MATTYYMLPLTEIVQFFTNLGIVAQGATITTQVAGSVSTQQTTYTDSTGLVPNANPLTVNAAGRAALQSGAQTAFWVAGGVVVDVYFTDPQGDVWSIKNMAGINDQTNATAALLTLLANPANSNISGVGPVAGVDLVANAVKAYDVFADARAANAPTLSVGQILSAEIQGALTIADGLGGDFYWSPLSTVTDDGRNTLRPNSVAAASPGRWLRYLKQGVPNIIVKPSDQSVISSTVLVADTALSVSLGVGVYAISARLLLLGNGATGQGYKIQPNFTGSTSSALLQAGAGVSTVNGTATAIAPVLNTAISAAAISSTNGDVYNFDFILAVTALGTFQIQFAQNSSTANATTMKANSVLTVTRVL